MENILNNWFSCAWFIFSQTIIATLAIYGVIFALVGLFKNGWILTKQPLGNHLFLMIPINSIIAAIYIYTLPIKTVKSGGAMQFLRIFDRSMQLTTVEAISVVGLYSMTLLICFILYNKIFGKLYGENPSPEHTGNASPHKKLHFTYTSILAIVVLAAILKAIGK